MTERLAPNPHPTHFYRVASRGMGQRMVQKNGKVEEEEDN